MILTFLIFILVQGCAVCDDLYPISVLRGIIENQVEGSSDTNNTIEARALPSQPYVPTDDPNINWIKKDIVVKYGFQEDDKVVAWKTGVGQPTFGPEDLKKDEFKKIAEKVERFFQTLNPSSSNPWQTTKNAFSNRDVLYLTAARYLLVTYILYTQSTGQSLIPCLKLSDGRYQIPAEGVCYPVPYGSAGWSSDYDVGLIGKSSGTLTKRFNEYFKVTFNMPSELVFDTNIYAFTLEYAMPFMFRGLPDTFNNTLKKIEETANFKMQELAGAYYKVYKYNNGFFDKLKNVAKAEMASQFRIELDKWLGKFEECNNKLKLRLEDYVKLLEFRGKHNEEYQKLVERMSQTMEKGYRARSQGDLAIALIYAAEAYHTRGAIRHVVGGTQMGLMAISQNIREKVPLSTNDLWVSMIENWGESNKEYNHCKHEPLKTCFLKMCKYMWRMFNAMSLIRKRIPASFLPGLVHFGAEADPEYAMKMWLAYKKEGKAELNDEDKGKVKSFLGQFHCDGAAANIDRPFVPECISKMNDAVNRYNKKLAKFLTNPTQKHWKP